MTQKAALTLGGFLIALIFLTLGQFMPLAAVYGYGYGYGTENTSTPDVTPSDDNSVFSSIKVGFDKHTVSGKTTEADKVRLKFSAPEEIRFLRVSKEKDAIDNAAWEKFDGDKTVKVRTEAGKKTSYYIQFKDINGNESGIYEKSVTYEPKSKDIRMSAKNVSRNEILTQSGKRFSKNSSVALYFSKNTGGYYAPMNVKTDTDGSFSVNYTVKKPKGTYRWYAVDLKTGKRSEMLSYRVIN